MAHMKDMLSSSFEFTGHPLLWIHDDERAVVIMAHAFYLPLISSGAGSLKAIHLPKSPYDVTHRRTNRKS